MFEYKRKGTGTPSAKGVRIEAPREGRVWGEEGAVPILLALDIQLTPAIKDDLPKF